MTTKQSKLKDSASAYRTQGGLKTIQITPDEFYSAVSAAHAGHGQLCIMLADEGECVIVPFSPSAAKEILDAGLKAKKEKNAQ